MFSLVLVISVMAIVASAKSIEEAPISRKESESERIVRGSNAVAGQFPYAGALHLNNRFICTSSIISPTTIMTAAHCVQSNGENQPADSLYVIANVSRVARSVRVNIERVIVHPNYNDRSIDNDIAILKTTEPIPFSDEVGPVCIAGPDTDPMQYRNATAMGWGNTSPIRLLVTIPETLQYVEQRIVPNNQCRFLNPGVNEDKICGTGFFTGVCNGDSGGPLVHLSADQPPVEIGIASYINALIGCGKGSPAVWTRVSSHYDFIMQSAEDSSICVV